MVDRLRGETAFARRGNSTLSVESLKILACESVSREGAEKRVDSASLNGFSSDFVSAGAASP